MKRRFVLLFVFVSVFCVAANTSAAAVTLIGAGSTFIYPIFTKWIKDYGKLHPNVQVSYDPVGSGRGITRAMSNTVDFAGSDGPLNDAQLKNASHKIVHIPVVVGAVVPAYNLPGVKQEVRFTPNALAGIYLGKITQWNDPEIANSNPDIHLPSNRIGVVFRSDGSGTTYVWTDYLSKISPEWNQRIGHGTSVSFPDGVAAQFNEGVVEHIKSHPYSLGYLQVTYAIQGHVQAGMVQNSSGKFVKADPASITAASASASGMPEDFRASITNASDANAYPISSFTWLLVPARIEDPQKHAALVGLLRWILTDGQKYAGPLDYAPLPGETAMRVLKAVDRIQ